MAPRARKHCNDARRLLGIAVPSGVSDAPGEGPQTIRRPLERSLGLAGNQDWLARFVRRWLVVRRWPGCLIGVRCPRSELFAGCHLPIPFQKERYGAAELRHQGNKRPGRIVPPQPARWIQFTTAAYLVHVQNCTIFEIKRNGQCSLFGSELVVECPDLGRGLDEGRFI
jgi:hypothetical protein